MARVTTVQKSMKDLVCGRCGGAIPRGSAYRWAKPGFRSRTRLVRCPGAGCSFRTSELTTSKLSEVYAAQEDALIEVDGAESVDDLESILTDAADRARDVAQEYRDAAEAMGEAGTEMEERADQIEEWADSLGDVSFEDAPEGEEEDGEEDDTNSHAEALDGWLQEQRQMAREALEDLPV